MKLIKYNRLKNGSGGNTLINTSSDGGGGGNSSIRTDGEERNIWGQTDTGDDIDGSMTVNGNITIKSIIPPSYEADGEDDDGEDEDIETGGGNLDVELTITSNKVEANETYGKKLFVNYPNSTSPKENVADLIKNNSDRITTNTTNITNLTTTVNSHTTQINANTANISNNTTNISTNTSEIAELKNKFISEDRIRELINELLPNNNGSYSNPVILYSGQIRRSIVSNDTYFVEGYKNNNISIAITDITNGLMTLEITPYNAEDDGYIYVGAVNVTQAMSGDTDNIETTSLKGRSEGAHWFETRSLVQRNKTLVYIREFHQGDQNNDTWVSNSWKSDNGIKQINVMISGYWHKMNS